MDRRWLQLCACVEGSAAVMSVAEMGAAARQNILLVSRYSNCVFVMVP
jgi:hypothetical protein